MFSTHRARASFVLLATALASGASLVVFACGDDADSPGRNNPDLDATIGDERPGAGPDSALGPDGEPLVPKPSYCDGVVFYARFDTGTTPDRGPAPIVFGTPSLDAGRYGSSAGFFPRSGTPNDAGTALYVAQEDGGAEVLPAQGTVTMWVRSPTTFFGPSTIPTFYRGVASLSTVAPVFAGLSLGKKFGPDEFGLFYAAPGNDRISLLTFPLAAFRPYLRQDDFNHLAFAWRKTGGAPTAVFALNGGLGELLSDAGLDASDPYRDAAPEAGELHTPYKSFTEKVWSVAPEPIAFRLGGPTSDAVPRADLDDVAVWNRVLSLDEIAATYQATASIGDTCEIP